MYSNNQVEKSTHETQVYFQFLQTVLHLAIQLVVGMCCVVFITHASTTYLSRYKTCNVSNHIHTNRHGGQY